MVSFPNAKINIGLHITERRSDGFHNIESCFVPVGWSDVLEIIPAQKLDFSSSGISIPGDISTNLCVKAYELLRKDFDLPPVQIHLHKVVPIGAGLGGGSADAAFTLKLLNEIGDLGLGTEDLENYARKLGSDCAFFIQNRPIFCYDKGDQFKDIEFYLPESLKLSGRFPENSINSFNTLFIVLVYPNLHISTAEAYSGVRPEKRSANFSEILQQKPNFWCNDIKNDFEAHLFVKYPVLGQIKSQLYEQGAAYASMTGSGSTVYGIFEKPVDLTEYFENYLIWQGNL